LRIIAARPALPSINPSPTCVSLQAERIERRTRIPSTVVDPAGLRILTRRLEIRSIASARSQEIAGFELF
jgi:hypothetical protein